MSTALFTGKNLRSLSRDNSLYKTAEAEDMMNLFGYEV